MIKMTPTSKIYFESWQIRTPQIKKCSKTKKAWSENPTPFGKTADRPQLPS
jgi:hypothetical protein